MAVADTVLQIMLEDGFLENVCRTGESLRQKIGVLCDKHPTVFKGVRGAGLMLGIECGPANTELVDLAREEGLIAVVAGENILRLVPPLIIDESHVAEAVTILDKVAGRVEQ